MSEDQETHDEIENGLRILVQRGWAEIVGWKDGQEAYRLTPLGHSEIEKLLKTNPDARNFLERLRKLDNHKELV